MRNWFPKLIVLILLVCFFVPLTTEGQIVKLENPLKAKDFTQLLNALIDFIFILAIGIAPIIFIIAGFYFVTAAGDPAKITTAKYMVLYTLIGLLIVICAKGLVALLGDVLGVKTPYNK